ncbi:MAG: rhodanese-like domain-containing protein [Bacteroidales bacterium]|nr:rhodanese-like domain-containing protein [Bacteroidales bacterium]
MRGVIILSTLMLVFGLAIGQEKTGDCFEFINADDFFLLVNSDDAIVLDVRLFREYKRNRISGAVSVATRKSLEEFCKTVSKNTTLLVYCNDGARSETASDILCRELKFKQVFSLERGLNAWKEKNYTIDKTRISKRNRTN